MIVECSLERGIQLMEPFDFQNFKLVLKGTAASEPRSWKDIAFVDHHNALIPIELVRALHDQSDDVNWQHGFAEMVMKARKNGWIEENSQAIRAHVERQP